MKIMCRPHPSVSLSVCHSVSETNPFPPFSWYSVVEFCTKRVTNKRSFREKRPNASRNLLKGGNEFLPAPSIFVDGFVWTGYRKLHIMQFCKYQINQNRSSGSHIVVVGANKKNIWWNFLNFASHLNTIRYRTCCNNIWGTVSSFKNRFFKRHHFLGWRGGTSPCGASTLFYFCTWSSTWRSSNGITETCCSWSNQTNVLCSDVVFVWI